jgi:predicted ester cyclase
MSAQNQRNKERVLAYWREHDAAPANSCAAVAGRHLAASIHWQGPAPFPDAHGAGSIAESFLAPLKRAFPDLRRETHIFMGGSSQGKRDGLTDGRMWVCGTGYLVGRQARSFLSIPPNNGPVRIRWAEFYRFEGDEIVQCQTLLDFVDWFEQIGRPVLPRLRGASFVYPAPTGFDGNLFAAQDPAETEKSQSLIRDFLFAGLNKFDKSNLESMGVARYFHPNVKWYGPGGIGACLSLAEFEDLHQKPWLVAYPDRKVQDLTNLFAEGRLVGSSAWSGVIATHTGSYLDCPATGKTVRFNGIDFWLRDGDLFTENWVFVDMVHLFAQFGVDLFDRLKHSNGVAPKLIPIMPDDPR